MLIDEISDFPEEMQEFNLRGSSVNTELRGTPETDFQAGRRF